MAGEDIISGAAVGADESAAQQREMPVKMSLHVLGLNHLSAPLEVREKVAFPADTQADALARLAAQPGVAEAVLVSTCNRTEIYFRVDEPEAVRRWLDAQAKRAGVDL